MGRYFETEQVFALYLLVAAIYFLITFAISNFSRKLSQGWAPAEE